MNLLTENEIKLYKTKLGNSDIIYIKGDTFSYKDILKKYGAKWNNPNKFWFWFLDKNTPNKTIDSVIKPALEEVKNLQKLPIEIDEIVKAIAEETPSSNPIFQVSKDDETKIKARLADFKNMLTNLDNDEEFKEIMKKVVDIKSAQGYQFSFGNSLLIFLQNMNAGIVNSKTNWLEKYNRIVNENATPLMIWAPVGIVQKLTRERKEQITDKYYKTIGKNRNQNLTPNEAFKLEDLLKEYQYASRFRIVPVYSENDTTQIEGKEDYIKAASVAKKDAKWFEEDLLSDEVKPIYGGLISFAQDKGIDVESVDDLGGSRGVSTSGKIKILKSEGNDVGITKTLAHEIAHELLHQTYLKNKGGDASSFYIGKISKQTVEQQAELTAWMFMYSFGFDLKTTSLTYTVLWGGDKENMVTVFNTVTKVVNYMIDEVNKRIKSVTEGVNKLGQHIKPEDIAKVLGVEKEYAETAQVALNEMKNTIKNIIKENSQIGLYKN